MNPSSSSSQRIKRLFVIFFPILITQVALAAMGVIDTMMAGLYSSADLAGVAIGASLWMPVSTGLSGILAALTPIVAQHLGARRIKDVSSSFLQAAYLSLALAVGLLLLGAFAMSPILNAMSLEAEVRTVAQGYLGAIAIGVAPFLMHAVLRGLFDGLGLTRITMLIALISVPINIVLNYVLIFGKLGLPALGGVGAGYGTALSYWIALAVAYIAAVRLGSLSQYNLFRGPYRLSLKAWAEQLRVGLPIGLGIFLEVAIFSLVTLLMSPFGTSVIAAHQAASSFAGLVYMAPLSVSMALTIIVGFEVGARNIDEAVSFRRLGIKASVAMVMVTATCIALFNAQIASWYTNDTEVLHLTRSFLTYVLFFQASDAFAAPFQGVLRGYKDVTASLIISLVAFWGVGLPLGHTLAHYFGMGPYGYWIGLISGLATGAIGLSFRLRHTESYFRRQSTGAAASTEEVVSASG